MIASLSTNPEVTDRGRKRVLAVLAAGTLIIVAYWVIWAIDRSVLASDTRPAYFEFENAFPLADGWVAICLVGASVTLRARRPGALFWLLTGGGAGVYLFCMDVLYDLQHGIWFKSGGGGLVELLINVITIVVSVGLLRWAWRRRAALLAGH